VKGDYLWIKCNGKITARIVAGQRRYKHPAGNEREFLLTLGLTVLGGDQSMKDLDVSGDHVIAFQDGQMSLRRELESGTKYDHSRSTPGPPDPQSELGRWYCNAQRLIVA